MKLSNDFIFGVATAAFQIEGARYEDGRTDSIWDVFCDEGHTYQGHNGNVACDHYHRYEDDIKLMRELGVTHYRLSISWPRIFPREGKFNPKGMDFYVRLLTCLRQNGIKPCITLYHWDLPVWLQDKGGWENRDSVKHFKEYADACFKHLDELAEIWMTHNEPWCASILSNHLGTHAPGKKDLRTALVVAHHILLSHGTAINSYRACGYKKPIGIAINLQTSLPLTNSEQDLWANDINDACFNRWFLDPLFKKSYPKAAVDLYSRFITDMNFVKEGDFEIIAARCDFLGFNYYQSNVVLADPNNPFGYTGAPLTPNDEVTAMNWIVTPEQLGRLIERIRRDYTDLPILITENGACFDDELVDGRVDDYRRSEYVLRHLSVIEAQNKKGNNVAGYFLWSFMDNFEWADGYSRRFGIIYTDYETLKRTPKHSYYVYKNYITEHKKP